MAPGDETEYNKFLLNIGEKKKSIGFSFMKKARFTPSYDYVKKEPKGR